MKHQWTFDDIGHIDPTKEAQGNQIQCAAGANNRAHLLQASGFDMDQHDQQAAEAYGFETVEEYRRAVAFSTFGQIQQQEEEDNGKEENKTQEVG